MNALSRMNRAAAEFDASQKAKARADARMLKAAEEWAAALAAYHLSLTCKSARHLPPERRLFSARPIDENQ